MTAGYYVDASMRPEATPDERKIIRALALYALRVLVKVDGEPVGVIPHVDGDSFTI